MANSFVLILSIDVLPVRLFEKRNWSLVKVCLLLAGLDDLEVSGKFL